MTSISIFISALDRRASNAVAAGRSETLAHLAAQSGELTGVYSLEGTHFR